MSKHRTKPRGLFPDMSKLDYCERMNHPGDPAWEDTEPGGSVACPGRKGYRYCYACKSCRTSAPTTPILTPSASTLAA